MGHNQQPKNYLAAPIPPPFQYLRPLSSTTMKISYPNPSCDQTLSVPKSLMGHRTACHACGHSFIWSDCFHTGDRTFPGPPKITP